MTAENTATVAADAIEAIETTRARIDYVLCSLAWLSQSPLPEDEGIVAGALRGLVDQLEQAQTAQEGALDCLRGR
ncbi:MAG TPA: hypothetical protein VK971_09065 [Thiohalobacter sp.]|nr:hypothetical protein [Thiohalobacter sp.]